MGGNGAKRKRDALPHDYIKFRKSACVGLNKKNFAAIAALYGKNSDEWVGKNMKVKIVTVESPRGGEVEAIRLYDPAGTPTPEPKDDEINPDEVPF